MTADYSDTGRPNLKGTSQQEETFDETLDVWMEYLNTNSNTLSKAQRFEARVVLEEAFHEVIKQNNGNEPEGPPKGLLTEYYYPTFLVSTSGIILQMNEAAIEHYSALPEQNIDDLGLITAEGKSVAESLLQNARGTNRHEDVTLIGARHQSSGRNVTLATLPRSDGAGGKKNRLISIIESRWSFNEERTVSDAFGLTEAETQLLSKFLHGMNLNEVAEETGKSIKTLRTQFHSILQKLDVRSQSDLIRKTLSISHFMRDIVPAKTAAEHPHRRKVNLIRPKFRSAEVFMAGDPAGKVIVVVPNVTLRTFPAFMEEEFKRRKLCVVTLCRPGYGNTDMPGSGVSVRECFADDFSSLLEQIGAKQATLLAQNSGCGFAAGLAKDVPQKVSKIVMVSGMPPLPYLTAASTNSRLSFALIRARKFSPKLFRLLMHLSLRAWKRGGIQNVHGRQIAPFPSDRPFLEREDIMQEFDAGMRSRFKQDLDFVGLDFENAVSDWSADVHDSSVPIKILHGEHDQAVSISDVRKWAAHHPDLIELIEVEGAGFLLPYSHTDIFLNSLAD